MSYPESQFSPAGYEIRQNKYLSRWAESHLLCLTLIASQVGEYKVGRKINPEWGTKYKLVQTWCNGRQGRRLPSWYLNWSRSRLPSILTWISCKLAFGHSIWAVKWNPHEICCPLPYFTLETETKVPHLHWTSVHKLITYQMCSGRRCEKCAVKRRIYFQKNWKWIVNTLKWVAED